VCAVKSSYLSQSCHFSLWTGTHGNPSYTLEWMRARKPVDPFVLNIRLFCGTPKNHRGYGCRNFFWAFRSCFLRVQTRSCPLNRVTEASVTNMLLSDGAQGSVGFLLGIASRSLSMNRIKLAVALGMFVFMVPMANAQVRGPVRPAAVRPTTPMPKPTASTISPKPVTPPASTARPISPASVSPQNSVVGTKSVTTSSTVAKSTTAARTNNSGRSGRQQHLKNQLKDWTVSKADKGWIKSEIKQMDNGNRSSIRNPPGKELAHARGREAAKGYNYEHSKLQLAKDHRRQHQYDNYGRLNKERPVTPPSPKPISTSSTTTSSKAPVSSTGVSKTTTSVTPRPSTSSSSTAAFSRTKK
jgi:hypothetical protein